MIYNFEQLSFQILSVSTVSHKDGFFDVAARPYGAFSFRTCGTAVFDIDGKRIVTDPGDMIYIPANMPYKVDYLSSCSLVVHLVDCNYCEADGINTLQAPIIEARLVKMLERWREDHSSNRAKAYLYDVFARLEAEASALLLDSEILGCIKYIEENYCDPSLRIDQVCDRAHVSRSSLQRRFVRCLGVTPKQYVNRLRINRAVDMLTEGQISIREVAYACGFDDEKYFSRVFKSAFGYPPASFIKNLVI